MRRQMRGVKVKQEKPKHTMATVTPLVMDIMDTIFNEQIDVEVHETRKRRCNTCEVRRTRNPGPSRAQNRTKRQNKIRSRTQSGTSSRSKWKDGPRELLEFYHVRKSRHNKSSIHSSLNENEMFAKIFDVSWYCDNILRCISITIEKFNKYIKQSCWFVFI